MKFIFSLFLILCSCAQSIPRRDYALGHAVYSKKEKFLAHEKKGQFGRYIAMNIAYGPIKKLYETIEKKEKLTLINRGEAHITVITPIEFFDVLKDKIPIKELNAMALDIKLQSSPFEVLCLGKGVKKLQGHQERTFFLVVSSQGLIHYRKKVEQLFLARGGKRGLFRAENFYPHITVGFSKRDLHESDGIIKNRKACYAELIMLE